MDLAKFIPSEMRLELAREVIEKTGIRPLARKIEVNPKSVYKYKRGTSHPSDEIMSKIIAVAAQEDSVSLNEHLERLKGNFSNALESQIEPEEVLEPMGGEEDSTSPSLSTKVDVVDQESTEQMEGQKSVVERSTEDIKFDELCDVMGVSTPFDRSKLEKFIGAFRESPKLGLNELIELSGLSESAVEKYIERMEAENFIKRDAEGNYQILVNISGEY